MARKAALYFGPAGIFSTDDPGADQRQIDAESAPFEEWDDDDYSHEDEADYPEVDSVSSACPRCFWHDTQIYYPEDSTEPENAKALLRERHKKEMPSCNGELEFG